jgi:DNA-binding response OmpR family regulator
MIHTYNILLDDDDADLRENLAMQFSFQEEFKTQQCDNGKSGIETV